MNEQVNGLIDRVVELVALYGLKVIGAIAILVIGLFIAGRIAAFTRKGLARSSVDPMLQGFFSSLVKYTVLAVTVIAVLNQFGVQTASLIAVLGATGLAIGLALQGTLSNVAAGVMLLLFPPFKVGDYIEVAGQAGTVKDVSLFTSELATPDNVQIIVPNGQVWGASIVNYSYHPTRRLDLALGIAYEDDIGKAKAAVEDLIKADSRCKADPAPLVAVSNLGESSVDFVIRIWCEAGDYWDLKWDMTRAVKERMDAEGITIPYPQRVVHRLADAAE
ncbi:mechanosensitive ion channel [Rhizobiales bacterium]|uniref:mechanosensitive ion channel family protein n=1 Tax=Hongsoonwoonella zoysiae TaxID=2821844 RepID=UPI0015601B04|nr:mechanosensitive ion channel domain-containing protein [Hongsoonwoonella zoysiae]NRG17821.1 mechanosensitive ion channel [Hongsoonwoonella zoysiae]